MMAGRSWQELPYVVDAGEHIGLVHSVVARVAWPNEDQEEMASQCMMALCRAAKKFEPERGFEFSTFATSVIESEILTIRSYRLRKKRDDRRTKPMTTGVLLSLVTSDPPGVMERDDEAMHNRRRLQHAMRGLTETQSAVLIGRALGQTLEAIAADRGVTKESVRQAELKALAIARERLGIDVATPSFAGSLGSIKSAKRRQNTELCRRRRERIKARTAAGG